MERPTSWPFTNITSIMKKSELDILRSFAAHVEKVMKAMPCLDGSRHKPRIVDAWRLAKRELERVKKILENGKT